VPLYLMTAVMKKSCHRASSGDENRFLLVFRAQKASGVKKGKKDTALWEQNRFGEFHLLLRGGQSIPVGNKTKTVKIFTVLAAVPVRPARRVASARRTPAPPG